MNQPQLNENSLSPVPAATPANAATDAAADAAVLGEAARRSRRAFLVGGLATLAGLGGWRWLATRPAADGIAWPLRRVLDANGQLSAAYFQSTRLAPEFDRKRGLMPRVNGVIGFDKDFDPAAWRLRVQAYAPGGPARSQEFTLADIKALPRVEMTTELKCIEGWSTIVTWAGARFADFVARYPLAAAPGNPGDPGENAALLAPYVGLKTPDGKYYVGLDLASALHPQTLLCYEMEGRPLTPAHGAPLRLVTPLKYGIKHLKRIGSIVFTGERPADYWAELGYDWDSGH